MLISLRKVIKNDRIEGFSGGCLNTCCGSGCSQYSSSHSTGKSRSKLATCESKHYKKSKRSTYSSSWIAHGRPNDELIWRSNKTSTLRCKTLSRTPWEDLAGLPKCPFPQFTFHGESFIIRLAPVSTNVLCQPNTYPNDRPTRLWGRRPLQEQNRQL